MARALKVSRSKTKTNMASLILRRFFCQKFSDIIKIRRINSLYGVSCGPFSHVRSKQKLRSLSYEFTHITRSSCSCLLRHFNFEREQPAPKLPLLFFVLGLATTNASCAEDDDLSSFEDKENCSEPVVNDSPSTPTDRYTRNVNGRFSKRNRIRKTPAGLMKGFKEWTAKRKLQFERCDDNEPPPKRNTRATTVRVMQACQFFTFGTLVV